MVVDLWNLARAEELFWGVVITVVTGSRYLGGLIGERDVETMWLDERVKGLADLVRTLSGVTRKHQKSAYAGLQKSLQQEWEFL